MFVPGRTPQPLEPKMRRVIVARPYVGPTYGPQWSVCPLQTASLVLVGVVGFLLVLDALLIPVNAKLSVRQRTEDPPSPPRILPRDSLEYPSSAKGTKETPRTYSETVPGQVIRLAGNPLQALAASPRSRNETGIILNCISLASVPRVWRRLRFLLLP